MRAYRLRNPFEMANTGSEPLCSFAIDSGEFICFVVTVAAYSGEFILLLCGEQVVYFVSCGLVFSLGK